MWKVEEKRNNYRGNYSKLLFTKGHSLPEVVTIRGWFTWKCNFCSSRDTHNQGYLFEGDLHANIPFVHQETLTTRGTYLRGIYLQIYLLFIKGHSLPGVPMRGGFTCKCNFCSSRDTHYQKGYLFEGDLHANVTFVHQGTLTTRRGNYSKG